MVHVYFHVINSDVDHLTRSCTDPKRTYGNKRNQVSAQIQRYMFFSVLHVCIIEIDFGFFLLELNLMVKALHHEVTCKNALLKAKCSEQEGYGLECVQYAIFDGPTYWQVKRTLEQFTPVCWDLGQRRVASTASRLACMLFKYSSLHHLLESSVEHIVSQV
ncbi:hypothetical protein Bca4012_021317 [Brassica carinata]